MLSARTRAGSMARAVCGCSLRVDANCLLPAVRPSRPSRAHSRPFAVTGPRAKRPQVLSKAAAVDAKEHGQSQDVPAGLSQNVWGQRNQARAYPQLAEDVQTDVVVAGAGLAGLLIAYELAKAGVPVVVLEARTRGSGQSGRSSGLLLGWNKAQLSGIEGNFGKEALGGIVESHLWAIDYIEEVVKAEGIECGFRRTIGYLIADSADPESSKKMDHEMDLAIKAGLRGTTKVNLEGAPGAGPADAAVRFEGCAELQPVELINGLAEAVQRRGGQIFEFSRVNKTDDDKVITDAGHTVTAKHVVMATGVPLNRNLAVISRQTAEREYLLALRLPQEDVKPAAYFDTAVPCHTARLVEGGSEGPLLVVGGEDQSTGRKSNQFDDEWGRLEAWARQRWPMAGDVVARWTCQGMKPIDKLALIGKDPFNNFQRKAEYYLVTGDMGQIATTAALAASIIPDSIRGRPNRFAEAYKPSRLPPPTASTVKGEVDYLTDVTSGIVSLVTPGTGTFKSPADIPPGSGAIMQCGTQKVALYVDEAGQRRGFAAACPHLGCLVEWNPHEKTFDCPCHGSHFSNDGKCINGPSQADLDPVDILSLGVNS